jgi:hypothetical protein
MAPAAASHKLTARLAEVSGDGGTVGLQRTWALPWWVPPWTVRTFSFSASLDPLIAIAALNLAACTHLSRLAARGDSDRRGASGDGGGVGGGDGSGASSHGGDGRGRGVFSPANADANGTAAAASARYSTSAADLASCHGLASENASGTAGASSDRRQSFISSSHCQAKSAR